MLTFRHLSHFIENDSGAVGVDWVVLSGGVVALGVAMNNVVGGAMADMTADIETQLRSDFVIQRSFTDASQNIIVANPVFPRQDNG